MKERVKKNQHPCGEKMEENPAAGGQETWNITTATQNHRNFHLLQRRELGPGGGLEEPLKPGVFDPACLTRGV